MKFRLTYSEIYGIIYNNQLSYGGNSVKRILCILCVVILCVPALTACPEKAVMRSVTSSNAPEAINFLSSKGIDTSSLIVGDSSLASSYDVDLSDFEDDGYVICSIEGQTAIFGKTESGLDRAVRDYSKHSHEAQYTTVCGEGYRVKRLTISGRDISEYEILIPSDSDECVTFAASELSSFIKDACGVALPIVTESSSNNLIELIPAQDSGSELGEEGFSVSVTNGRVSVNGGNVRGCLYGVYDILEDLIGYRFLTAWETYLYPSEHVDIPEGYTNTETPALDYRCIYDHSVNYTYSKGSFVSSPEFNARRKSNSEFANEAKYGYYGLKNAHHGMSVYIKSVPDARQPCLYDNNLFDECVENILEYLDAQNKLGNIGTKVKCVDLGENDNSNFCPCRKCMNMTAVYGSRAGCFVDFTNRVTEEINVSYPDMIVGMFAYWGAIIPPKNIEIHKNVQVCYVIYGFCQQHPLDGSECGNYTFQEGLNNKVHKEYLKKWQELTPRVHVWFYTVDFWRSLAPFMNIDDYRADFEYLADTGIVGVFCQNGQSQLSFDDLNVYLESIVAWDPYITDEEFDGYVREFMELYYGDGWEALYEYLMLGCRKKDSLYCNEHDIYDYIGENYDYFKMLFQYAADNCNTATQADRIERLSIHMHFQAIASLYEDKYVNGTEEERAEISRVYRWIYDELIKYKIVRMGLESERWLKDMPFNENVSPLDWMAGETMPK